MWFVVGVVGTVVVVGVVGVIVVVGTVVVVVVVGIVVVVGVIVVEGMGTIDTDWYLPFCPSVSSRFGRSLRRFNIFIICKNACACSRRTACRRASAVRCGSGSAVAVESECDGSVWCGG